MLKDIWMTFPFCRLASEAAVRGVLYKKVVLKISQIQRKTPVFAKSTGKHLCQSLFFNEETCNSIKKRLWHRCFPVNFAKFLRTIFLQNTSGRLIRSSSLPVSFLTSQCLDSPLLQCSCYSEFHWIKKVNGVPLIHR